MKALVVTIKSRIRSTNFQWPDSLHLVRTRATRRIYITLPPGRHRALCHKTTCIPRPLMTTELKVMTTILRTMGHRLPSRPKWMKTTPATVLPPARRRRDPNALVEGADGQYYHAHEIERAMKANGDGRGGAAQGDETMRERRSKSQPIPWPQQLGLAPQTVHVKQTSLFRAPEEEQAMRAQQSTRTKPGQPHITWMNGLQRKHSRESDGDLRLAPQEVRYHVSYPILALPLSNVATCH